MKVRAIVDPGKGSVYHPTFESLALARAFVRGPYSKGFKVVLESRKGFECYDAGVLVAKESR